MDQHSKVIGIHTDLKVGAYCDNNSAGWPCERWLQEISEHNVLIMTTNLFLRVVSEDILPPSRVNLIVLDECHKAVDDHPYVEMMRCFDADFAISTRVLGLTSSILNDQCSTPSALESRLGDLEQLLHGSAETASDLIMADLYGARPTEKVIKCDNYCDSTGLVAELCARLQSALNFLDDLKLAETSDEGGGEGGGGIDASSVKDPRAVARIVLKECHNILLELGPWCAARAAQAFAKQLIKFEEHERDDDGLSCCFIQLAATQVRLVQRIIDDRFDRDVQTLDDFFGYLSPRVCQLIEVLHEYKPDDNFIIIGGDDFSDSDVGGDDDDESDDSFNGGSDDDEKSSTGGVSPWAARSTSSSSARFSAKSSQHYIAVKRTITAPDGGYPPEEDGICAIVFVRRKHAAFVLNKLIVELCNWDPDLYFVRSHYITGQSSATGATKDTETQYQKQEDVLRKFRQREINVLVSTSVLEEGVDVPRCNLIVRFDLPTSYWSYVQSKVCTYHI